MGSTQTAVMNNQGVAPNSFAAVDGPGSDLGVPCLFKPWQHLELSGTSDTLAVQHQFESMPRRQTPRPCEYQDYSSAPVVTIVPSQRRLPKGSIPEQLHQLLELASSQGYDDIIQWLPHGRAFCVHDPKQFLSQLAPFITRTTKFSGFLRQLSHYGFTRSSSKTDAGAYFHAMFRRDRPDLAKLMRRRKASSSNGEMMITAQVIPSQYEPSFYPMPVLLQQQQEHLQQDEPQDLSSVLSAPAPVPKQDGALVSATTSHHSLHDYFLMGSLCSSSPKEAFTISNDGDDYHGGDDDEEEENWDLLDLEPNDVGLPKFGSIMDNLIILGGFYHEQIVATPCPSNTV